MRRARDATNLFVEPQLELKLDGLLEALEPPFSLLWF